MTMKKEGSKRITKNEETKVDLVPRVLKSLFTL